MGRLSAALALVCAGAASPPEPPVLPLTGATFGSALSDHPLLFVLFYSSERVQGTHLLQNYSLAAQELRQAKQHRAERPRCNLGEDRRGTSAAGAGTAKSSITT